MDKINEALSVFKDGFNCSQAVSSVFSEEYGVEKTVAARMASALGAGISYSGEVCGVVSGALMVIGLKYGSSVPADTKSKEKSYDAGKEYLKRFKAKHGTVVCRQLIGMDISTSDGLKAAREKGVFKDVCFDLVKSSIEILEDVLNMTK